MIPTWYFLTYYKKTSMKDHKLRSVQLSFAFTMVLSVKKKNVSLNTKGIIPNHEGFYSTLDWQDLSINKKKESCQKKCISNWGSSTSIVKFIRIREVIFMGKNGKQALLIFAPIMILKYHIDRGASTTGF